MISSKPALVDSASLARPDNLRRQAAACMPALFTLKDEAMELVVLNLDHAGTVEAAALLLSDDERRRAARFRLDETRQRYILARLALRHLLAERLGAEPQSIAFVYNRYGKPSLACHRRSACAVALHFNASHSAQFAAYAFSTHPQVGVDIEQLRPLRDMDRIAARFFSPEERRRYAALAPNERLTGFYACWTRKEAFVKATGRGLSFPLSLFDVSLAPSEPARLKTIAGEEWMLRSFAAPGFIGAVVLKRPLAGTLVAAAPPRLLQQPSASSGSRLTAACLGPLTPWSTAAPR